MSVVWRPAVHGDLPRIKELWDEQDERFAGTGVKVDRPQLFHDEDDTDHTFFPYHLPITRVQVAEKDGRIAGFRYIEIVPEMSIVTGDEEVMKSLGNELTEDAQWLKARGFRTGWGLVPTKFIGAMSRFLRKHPHIRPWRSLTPIGIDFSELGD